MSRGRPTKSPDVPTVYAFEVELLVKNGNLGKVDTWLKKHADKQLDAELELLASFILASSFPVPQELRSLAARGGTHLDDAFAELISRMKRRFAKTLRDHQRSDDDDIVDAVEEV